LPVVTAFGDYREWVTAEGSSTAGTPPTQRSSSLAEDDRTHVDLHALIDRLVEALVLADDRGVVLAANQAAAKLFGTAVSELIGKPLTALMPERFRAAHQAAFARVVATGSGPLVDGPLLRVAALRGDGSEVEVDLSLGMIGRPGEPGFAFAARLRDVRERAHLEGQVEQSRYLRASMEASPDGVLAVSPERRVLAINRRFHELWGMTPGSVAVGDMSPLALSYCLSRVADSGELRAALADNPADQLSGLEVDIPLVDGSALIATARPLVDDVGNHLGRVWYMRDDTARRVAAQSNEELLERLRAAQRSQSFLLLASDVLARASSYAETIERLAAVSVPALGDLCFIDIRQDDGRLVRLAARHADPEKRDLVAELERNYPPLDWGPHPSVLAIQTGESRWSSEMSEQFLRETTRDERHFDIVNSLNFTSYMAVPLIAENTVLGCVTIVSAGSGRRFGPEDLALTERLAERVAQVVVRARRYDREHLASHALQSSLLPPDPPELAGLRTTARYLPGTLDVEVGGDFYDVVHLPSGAVAFAIGDVVGHDLIAATTMGQLRSVFRALLATTDGPYQLIKEIQEGWPILGLPRLATALFGRLDVASGELLIASAGHPPPLLVTDDYAAYLDVSPSPLLGSPGETAAEWAGHLPHGSTLLLYTDGLVEHRHQDIDVGLERLRRVSADAGARDPEQLCNAVVEALISSDRRDDVAILAVTRD
jgi:PAS domain S-box-containing protein